METLYVKPTTRVRTTVGSRSRNQIRTPRPIDYASSSRVTRKTLPDAEELLGQFCGDREGAAFEDLWRMLSEDERKVVRSRILGDSKHEIAVSQGMSQARVEKILRKVVFFVE